MRRKSFTFYHLHFYNTLSASSPSFLTHLAYLRLRRQWTPDRRIFEWENENHDVSCSSNVKTCASCVRAASFIPRVVMVWKWTRERRWIYEWRRRNDTVERGEIVRTYTREWIKTREKESWRIARRNRKGYACWRGMSMSMKMSMRESREPA